MHENKEFYKDMKAIYNGMDHVPRFVSQFSNFSVPFSMLERWWKEGDLTDIKTRGKSGCQILACVYKYISR